VGLSRTALWNSLQEDGPVVEPLLRAAYEHELEREWQGGNRAPHGFAWHTSFHASSFPGNTDSVCGRRAVYELLDPPEKEPRSADLQAWFDLGTDLEHRWIQRFASYGSLLSANVTGEDQFQTGFVDPDVWLTGSTDAIVLPRGWRKSHFVEVKTTSHEKVLSMRSRSPVLPLSHAKYVRQLKTYICMGHELPFTPTINVCDESGAIISRQGDYVCPIHGRRCAFETITLAPPDDGTLIYSSREEPLTVASFRVYYDSGFLKEGRRQLAEWRDYFLRDEIPPHPAQGRAKKWTSPWCQYCPHKATFCKADDQGKVTKLSESGLVEHAKSIRPNYDVAEKRASVLYRWNIDDPLSDGRIAEDQRVEETVDVN
jgi:hypothetical protein